MYTNSAYTYKIMRRNVVNRFVQNGFKSCHRDGCHFVIFKRRNRDVEDPGIEGTGIEGGIEGTGIEGRSNHHPEQPQRVATNRGYFVYPSDAETPKPYRSWAAPI
jgi:hypothetical protein